jgi:hypothetical protein
MTVAARVFLDRPPKGDCYSGSFGARLGKAVASDHLRSSSYGASANLARSRHSGATVERLPYLRRDTGTERHPHVIDLENAAPESARAVHQGGGSLTNRPGTPAILNMLPHYSS